VLGFIFGWVSGFVLGVVGSVINHRLGWPLAGILSGAVFYQLYRWFLMTLSRGPSWPADRDLLLMEVALPVLWFGILGLVVECALRRGRPHLPRLETLSRALAQRQHP